MNRIAVFCGSSLGNEDQYSNQASLLGKTLASLGIGLVYGGGKVGLMGAVADGALSRKGEVIGVLPNFLRPREFAHEGLTELILVDSMHERKTKMFQLCDGFIALPGGFGTLEELFEMITWAQLGLHQKPVGLLNIDGFYNALIELLNIMVDRGFLKDINRKMLLVNDDIDDLLQAMTVYVAPKVLKWIDQKTL
ncbi:MAG: TIGR00730 family Rossman fold protein [Saprospiraceae bacterium]|nr:TIGR00730 family Rossman fold protein [Saprospiraceae bacterium]